MLSLVFVFPEKVSVIEDVHLTPNRPILVKLTKASRNNGWKGTSPAQKRFVEKEMQVELRLSQLNRSWPVRENLMLLLRILFSEVMHGCLLRSLCVFQLHYHEVSNDINIDLRSQSFQVI